MWDLKSLITRCTVYYATFTYIQGWENHLPRTHTHMERDLSRNLMKEKENEAGWREPEDWLRLPASNKRRAVPLRRDKLGPKHDPSTVSALNPMGCSDIAPSRAGR